MSHHLMFDLEIGVSIFSIVVCAGVGLLYVAAWIEEAWRREHRPYGSRYSRYHAEQAIRRIRRQAIRDMLNAERTERYFYDDPDVIEGTAVEIRR